MTDTLRERVARAIDKSLCNARVTENNLFYLPEADAAIALVLEEAARCAEDCSVALNGTYEAIHIAAAIRALKEKK